jgi:hypothetical protein
VLEADVSIVRQGLAEDGKFGAGYEAIFGKAKGAATEDRPAKKDSKKAATKAKEKASKEKKGKKPAKKK